MNVRLLRRVAKHILEEPKRLDMEKIAENVEGRDSPPCGTVGCIAGWACMLTGSSVKRADWGKGRRLIGLDGDQAYRLFDYPLGLVTDGWPEKFSKPYVAAKTARQRARIAVARIEHFIKTKGTE
jgi:hypothetical protein